VNTHNTNLNLHGHMTNSIPRRSVVLRRSIPQKISSFRCRLCLWLYRHSRVGCFIYVVLLSLGVPRWCNVV